MEHDAHAHAGAHVGGASGQITELFVKSIRDALFDRVVDVVDAFPSGHQIQAALHHLHAQMVFLAAS